jgi:uncharacterized Zn finger protein
MRLKEGRRSVNAERRLLRSPEEPTMRRDRAQILTRCDVCGGLASLKTINDYPFSKGFSEATYECRECGATTKRAMSGPKRAQHELHVK